jgi:hypothetical protein
MFGGPLVLELGKETKIYDKLPLEEFPVSRDERYRWRSYDMTLSLIWPDTVSVVACGKQHGSTAEE